MSDNTSHLPRWRPHLLEFEFDVVLREGVKHPAADPLSRLPTTGNGTSTLEENSLHLAVKTLDTSQAHAIHFIDAHACSHQPTTTTPVLMNSEHLPRDYSEPTSIQNFSQEHSSDLFCHGASWSVEQPNSDFSIDRHGLLVRRSSVDESVQTVVP